MKNPFYTFITLLHSPFNSDLIAFYAVFLVLKKKSLIKTHMINLCQKDLPPN